MCRMKAMVGRPCFFAFILAATARRSAVGKRRDPHTAECPPGFREAASRTTGCKGCKLLNTESDRREVQRRVILGGNSWSLARSSTTQSPWVLLWLGLGGKRLLDVRKLLPLGGASW
jgi:hypothetical protein